MKRNELNADGSPEAAAAPVIRKAAGAVIATIVVGALYLGREVFVPIALAVLLSFVLAPLVHRLQRLRLPRPVAVISVVIVTFAAVFALGGAIATQVAHLTERLPAYQQTIQTKIQSVRGLAGSTGPLQRAADMLQDLSKQLDKPEVREPGSITTLVPENTLKPVVVEVRQPDPGMLATLGALISPLISPLTTTGVTIIFVIFILLQREDIRNRFIRLAGSHDLQQTTIALDDAGSRLSRLFLSQLAINVGFGVLIGAGLWLIGIPNALLWGVLGAVLRFVPYIGAVISALLPLALAAAVDPGWTMLVWTFALFAVGETLVGQVLEPLVYGHSTGLSPLAIIVSATFWTWLWGPIGLVLATPLTICLVVLGRHAEQLEFLNILLGDEMALTPAQMFYQRMLADDPAEAADQAETVLREKPLLAYYDSIALDGLRLAQIDVARGVLTAARLSAIRDSVKELIIDLKSFDGATAANGTTGAIDQVTKDPDLPQQWKTERAVLCVAGRNALDESAALILQEALVKSGFGAIAEPAAFLSSGTAFQFDSGEVQVVCLSYMDGAALTAIRYATRKIRRKLPQARILACCWSSKHDEFGLEALCREIGADGVVTNFGGAVSACFDLAVNPLEQKARDVDVMLASQRLAAVG